MICPTGMALIRVACTSTVQLPNGVARNLEWQDYSHHLQNRKYQRAEQAPTRSP